MIRPRIPRQRITQRRIRVVAALAAIAAIAGFFGYEFRYLRAPDLELATPTRDIISDSDIIDVRGRTDPDADVTLNGRPLFIAPDGAFEERVYLGRGLNRLEFEARNRYGKMTTVSRYLVLP